MERIGLVHLNLGIKKALVLLRNSEHEQYFTGTLV